MKPILHIFLLLLFSPVFLAAKETSGKPGTIVIRLDDVKYGSLSFQESFVILDKFDGTGAGTVSQKFPVRNNEILLTNIPQGKYYVDVFTLGKYRGHFTAVIYSGRKVRRYTLQLTELSLNKQVLPAEDQTTAVADSPFQ